MLVSGLVPLLIFGPTPYATVAAVSSARDVEEDGRRLVLALTPARYAWLRGGLLGTLLLTAGALGLLWRAANLRAEWYRLRQEINQTGGRLRQLWTMLSPHDRRLGGGLLLLLTLVRLAELLAYPIGTDEVASYDYFVRAGPVTIASFYPAPNNHPLLNLLCWPLSRLTGYPPLVMRLPTLLASTVGTGGAYLLLTRRIGFRAATLSTGLFSFSPLGIYYAVAGRGYFLQLTLLLAAFFAALALLQTTRFPRVAWAIFGGASIAGLYTVPTFAYPLAALALGVGIGFGHGRRWADVGRLALLGAAVVVGAGLLYAPIVAVSGLARLIGNRYVAPLAAPKFWGWFPGHLRVQADALAGYHYLGSLVVAALALLGPVLWLRQPARRPLLGLLGLLLLVPVALMAGQRVLAPARTLLFMGYFGSVGISLILVAGLDRLRVPARGQLLALVLLIGGYAGYQVAREAASLRVQRRQARQLYASYRWLVARAPQRVWLSAPLHRLWWHHYALTENRPSLRQQPAATPSAPYEYAVLPPDARARPAWVRPPHYALAYRDELVRIYHRTPNR